MGWVYLMSTKHINSEQGSRVVRIPRTVDHGSAYHKDAGESSCLQSQRRVLTGGPILRSIANLKMYNLCE